MKKIIALILALCLMTAAGAHLRLSADDWRQRIWITVPTGGCTAKAAESAME